LPLHVVNRVTTICFTSAITFDELHDCLIVL
jgi:hypothetical protein